jgi:WD40 repeat protein
VAAASATVVRVWDVATGRKRHSFTGHPDPQAVTFGPDGRTVAAVSPGGLVRVWDVVTGRTRTTHDGRIDGTAVALSPDGRTYAVVRTDGSVQLREVATGIVQHTIRDGAVGSNEVAFAPDGRTLAIPGPGDTVRLWDTASGTERAAVTAGHHGRGMKVALSSDGRTLVTSSKSGPTIRVNRLPADPPQTTLPGPTGTYIGDLAFSSDGRTVATVRQGPPGRGSVQLWDAGTGDREAALALDTDPAPGGKQPPITVLRLGAVGFDPTGHALAARVVKDRATKNRVIEVREVATGRLRRSRALGAVDTAVFSSPDGTRLAIVDSEGSVRMWNLSTSVLHTVRTGHGQTVRAVAFTPDGRTLAVVDIEAGGDQVRLLDAGTGRAQRTVKPSTGSLLSLAFTPDGHTLATAGGSSGSVKMWDTRTGRLQDSFRVGGGVASLAFSPDARTLAASSARGVQLWDLATSQTRLALPTRSPGTVVFSPDGRTLAIGTGGSVGLWTVDLPDPARAIRTICEAVDATLTPLEQSRYLHDQSAQDDCRPAVRQDHGSRA